MTTHELASPVRQQETPRSLFLSEKIEARHLARLAIVYVRQSSTRQVRENVESTQLQYALVNRVRAYGWQEEQTETIDDDLGVSGKSLEGRAGFQRLLAEISLGHVGIVMGIEMSRLARNCRDWHQLLELCAVFGSLLGDADGIYDPREHNDRLLLGLKGTMSEAELHVLHGRLHAGKKNKARRGEYFGQVPIGYVRTREGVIFELDEQARNIVKLLFEKFEELGSANAVLRYFHQEQIMVGVRTNNGLQRDELTWRPINRSTIIHILHHPMYAGAYVYGRKQSVPTISESGVRKTALRNVGRDDWPVLIKDKVPAYITWEQWERNQKRLKENSTKFGFGPSRGSSLLAGRIVCGKCGARMTVHYRDDKPYFCCCAALMNFGQPRCQSFDVKWLDPLVVELVLKALMPASIQLSLEACESIESDRERLDKHHRQSVERATYEADLSRRRYQEVDPSNRLVAAELERAWESQLHVQRKCEEALNRFRNETPVRLTTEQRESITALSTDFSELWHSSTTTNIDRQNIIRLLIDDIVVEVINASERLSVSVHWSGGFTSQHESRRRVGSFDQLEASEALANRAQQLYNEGCPLSEIAKQLNHEGYMPAKGDRFTKTSMGALSRTLRRKGLIKSTPEIAPNYWRAGALSEELGIGKPTLTGWRHRRWVQVRQVGSRWIYWADAAEMTRLRKLAAHPASGSTPTPDNLTIAASKMPVAPE